MPDAIEIKGLQKVVDQTVVIDIDSLAVKAGEANGWRTPRSRAEPFLGKRAFESRSRGDVRR
jgi:hypothetical protein